MRGRLIALIIIVVLLALLLTAGAIGVRFENGLSPNVWMYLWPSLVSLGFLSITVVFLVTGGFRWVWPFGTGFVVQTLGVVLLACHVFTDEWKEWQPLFHSLPAVGFVLLIMLVVWIVSAVRARWLGFLYCALMGLPWVVFRGHSRTSTYLADSVRTLANIVDNFKSGETYNIGGDSEHTIEDLSDTILRVTGANPKLVEYRDSEILTTKHKRVDTSKSVRDLGHRNSYGLEQGIRLTAEWMRRAYDLPVNS